MFTSLPLLPSFFIVVFFSFTVHIQKLLKINPKLKKNGKNHNEPPKTVGFYTVRYCKKRGFRFGFKTVPSLIDHQVENPVLKSDSQFQIWPEPDLAEFENMAGFRSWNQNPVEH